MMQDNKLSSMMMIDPNEPDRSMQNLAIGGSGQSPVEHLGDSGEIMLSSQGVAVEQQQQQQQFEREGESQRQQQF